MAKRSGRNVWDAFEGSIDTGDGKPQTDTPSVSRKLLVNVVECRDAEVNTLNGVDILC